MANTLQFEIHNKSEKGAEKMKEYQFDNHYNIIVLQRKSGPYEYYLEKVNYSSLAFMFGIHKELDPSGFTKDCVFHFIKKYENQKFWGED